MVSKLPAARTVDDIIIPPEPASGRRPASTEAAAFLTLSRVLAEEPQRAVQSLVDAAMRLTGADSAGVSLEDVDGDAQVFRWVAAAGDFARYLGGTMPRDGSPCGTVVERGKTLVMKDPARFFTKATELDPYVHSILMVPYSRRGKFVGTVWVAASRPDKSFTTEDVRVVEQLTIFSSALLDALRVPRRERK